MNLPSTYLVIDPLSALSAIHLRLLARVNSNPENPCSLSLLQPADLVAVYFFFVGRVSSLPNQTDNFSGTIPYFDSLLCHISVRKLRTAYVHVDG